MTEPLVPDVPFTSYTPRVAIVTGGTQGIGYAIANRLADDGINIAVNDIPSKQPQIDAVVEEIKKKSRRAIAVPGDVCSEADVISIVEKVVSELGSVDIMVANAGIAMHKSILDTTLENFEAIHAVNNRGVFLCLKYAAAQMVKQGRGGRLIAASSVVGKMGSLGLTAYSASKFAVRGLTQSASADLRKYGITVNTYAPGIIRTAMFAGSDEGSIKSMSANPVVGEAETVASLVSYYAKPESYFINGQCVTLDGGSIRYD
ncbi:NAD-binding protein [Fomitiporia mediterranea MF3/22]|uniref:NAD-binding protein n=1 Tax=Fomitiporia mediterranea (strain MF3/22) TaxID=694068 RepID=UPI00044074E2|nr:NAD-binding protein [Fomitiporia mediterranea MF3/22]EJD06800.1 NAD-binding protein [Fomitiporia mediterranea MF3/22]